jgi:hypothetical protein
VIGSRDVVGGVEFGVDAGKQDVLGRIYSLRDRVRNFHGALGECELKSLAARIHVPRFGCDSRVSGMPGGGPFGS